MSIEIVKQAMQPTLYVRLRTSLDKLNEAFDQSFAKITTYLNEIGEYPASAPYAAYYNHDMQDLDVEMGFPVTKTLAGKGEIKAGEIPSSEKAVSATHKGPYSTLDQTYNEIYGYIEKNKLEISGAHYDFYTSNPDDTPENELLTKIVIPVK